MSLAAWALLVASLSAAGTVANMISSWATYKRRRPRVEVSCQLLMPMNPETGRRYLSIEVTIVNHGENAVNLRPVASLSVATAQRFHARSYWKYETWRYIRGLQKSGHSIKWEWRGVERQVMMGPLELTGDVGLEVAPFNGVKWQAEMGWIPDVVEGVDHVYRVGVLLSTGRMVHSSPLPYQRWEAFMIFGTEEVMPGQLSILDLCQAEEVSGDV
ncbi:hypothetical protein [Streptomyces sp. NPDC005760]|uniref:hypothetical protein n=1 Tax=Streptomyces sp. NPDC005760 TaxID=3156718 RepID=UPI0033C6DF01